MGDYLRDSFSRTISYWICLCCIQDSQLLKMKKKHHNNFQTGNISRSADTEIVPFCTDLTEYILECEYTCIKHMYTFNWCNTKQKNTKTIYNFNIVFQWKQYSALFMYCKTQQRLLKLLYIHWKKKVWASLVKRTLNSSKYKY